MTKTKTSKMVYSVLVKEPIVKEPIVDGEVIAEIAVAGQNMAEVLRFIADECEFSSRSIQYPYIIYITPENEVADKYWENQIITEKIYYFAEEYSNGV